MGGLLEFTDETLGALVATGCKVTCPVCGRRAMSQIYADFHSSGIGQHMRASHPEVADRVVSASRRLASARKAKSLADEAEARARPLRQHVVTGAFLDEVSSEIRSLMGMMEPYFAQCDSATSAADDLLERIDAMQAPSPATDPFYGMMES